MRNERWAYLVLTISIESGKVISAGIFSADSEHLTHSVLKTTLATVTKTCGDSYEEANDAMVELVTNHPSLKWVLNYMN